jgi:hypothetical protein
VTLLFWKDMLQVKHIYLKGRRMQVGNGRNTSFRGDPWCDQYPLKDRFPDIHDICIEQIVTVAEATALNWRFSFRRRPDDTRCSFADTWLSHIVSQTTLNEDPYKPFRKWANSGKVYCQFCVQTLVWLWFG